MGGVKKIMDDLEFMPSPVRIRDLKKLGEGRQAELFGWPNGMVVKLFRSPRDGASARLEAAVMHLLQPTGIPMPRLFGTAAIEQRPGIVMEHLVGTDQLSLLRGKPWTIWRSATNLARLHVQLHSTVAPEQLRSLRLSVREEIDRSEFVPSDIKERALAALNRLPEGPAVCHWDFHPANIIETPDGPKVIDWANVCRGARLADVARTLLILRGGALPPGTPFLVQRLIAFARSVLTWRYLREYRRLLPFADAELDAWALVSAASRLTYGISHERGYLLRLLGHGSRGAVVARTPGARSSTKQRRN
jgi:Ser/Thr protein kinase RdoA (MazF antagonist)